MLATVEWSEFRIGDLFEIENTLSFNKEALTQGTEYDYVTRTSQNQGILQTTGFVNEENINPAGTWSLGLLQMDFFYREKPWYAGQFVRKIKPKIKLHKKAILFFTTLLNRQKGILLSVLVRDVDRIFKNTKIQLPVKNGEIDFDFMESFVAELEAQRLAELEAQRLAELEAYLMAAGLSDYTLSPEEESALNHLDKQNWAEFKIGDLFDVDSWCYGKNKTYQTIFLEKNLNTVEVISGITVNNGVNYYTSDVLSSDEIFEGELTISTRGEYSGTVFYHQEKFALANNILVMKMPNLTKNQKLFIGSIINALSYGGYSGYPKKDTLKKDKIFLPTKNGEIDFKFMELLISAVQKIVIKDVVKYADRKIDTTKALLQK